MRTIDRLEKLFIMRKYSLYLQLLIIAPHIEYANIRKWAYNKKNLLYLILVSLV